MVKRIFLVLAVAVTAGAHAQPFVFYDLRRLPSPVNSAAEELLPLLSPDAQLFFSRALYAANAGGKYSGTDIWYTEGRDDAWRNPSNTLPAIINTSAHNALIGFSEDGSKRYFISASPHDPVTGIYVTTRINEYWTRPELLAIPGIETQKFMGAYVSPDAEVIFFSMQGSDSQGEEDLYFSVKDDAGRWQAPKNMGRTLNTPGFEIAPFLSPDKKRLYFASNGHGGEGDADIFYSERLYDSWETWSMPVNLGKEVNSPKFDGYFSVYGDSLAYFVSNRDSRMGDIYEVKVRRRATVLAEGEHYLSQSAWERQMGGAVSTELVFADTTTSLTPAQEELLFFIGNKLQLRRSIRFHLAVEEEDDPARSEARLQAVAEHLSESGIGEDRIVTEQVDTPRESNRGVIVIRAFE